MSHEHITFLNNLAITSCFQHGRFDSAIKVLLSALHKLSLVSPRCFVKTSRINQVRHDGFTYNHQQEANTQSPGRSKSLHWVKIETPNSFLENPPTLSPSAMYQYAVILSGKNEEGIIGNQLWHATRATLLYNLAHIYHWQAIYLGISSATSIALEIYEEAVECLKHLPGNNDGEWEQLVLAVVNNMGHIRHQQLQYDEARQCFYILRLRLSTWIGSLPLLDNLEGNETFVLNAMLPPLELQFAPAA